MELGFLKISIIASLLSLAFVVYLARYVLSKPHGNATMERLSEMIQEGARAFLRREYTYVFSFVLIIGIALIVVGLVFPDVNLTWRTAIAFAAGAIASALAGFLGMNIATQANSRTAAAAESGGVTKALDVAISGGAVMGMGVVGIALLGLAIVYKVFNGDTEIINGYAMGASLVALFARSGGGIFTKGADMGADLVGKVEAGIPEDDPRNPAVIADNVGDNVGDVAGMGADLFESYVSSIIAAIALATVGTAGAIVGWDDDKAVLPLMLAGAGIVAAILGTFVVRSSEQANFGQLLWALRRGIFASAILLAVFALVVVLALDMDIKWFWAIITGLTAGIIIGLSTEYYTSYDYKPTQQIAESSQTGAATVMISGIATGMISTVVPLVAVAFTIIIAFELSGFYGVALAGVGLLSTLGITLATDAYGPVADNAGGIAEQAQLDPEVRERTDALDALGNTTAATGKGFAIGSAALTSLALLAAFAIAADIKTINLLEHTTIVGILFGAMLPFLFSAFTMKAVGRAAMDIVAEVRRQFREIPGLLEGTAEPDYNECVDIATKGALKEMIVPGLMAVAAPLATGFVLGVEALGGMLIGAVGSGFMLAIMMATAGGAWDNAKKYVELGHYGGKGSDAHKAAVEGDVVGDPFKDTSGPSLNILLKLMAIVSLVFAPVFLEVTPLIDVIT